jgi:hypothetical protein
MKAVIKSLLRDPCRSRDLSENEKESFATYSHLQRYYPALDLFTIPDSTLSHKNTELPTKYRIHEWLNQEKDNAKFWKATRIIHQTDIEADAPLPEECNVFTKIVHLLNPVDILKEKYRSLFFDQATRHTDDQESLTKMSWPRRFDTNWLFLSFHFESSTIHN